MTENVFIKILTGLTIWFDMKLMCYLYFYIFIKLQYFCSTTWFKMCIWEIFVLIMLY